MRKKCFKAFKIALASLLVWVCILTVDLVRVGMENRPIFCVEAEKGNGAEYWGIGYMFETYPHLVTWKNEFALYIFGQPVMSNFTN